MSDKVRVQYAAGTIGKCVAARILPGTDLLTGIEKACEENGIAYASVTCFGSLEKAGYLVLVPNPKAKIGAGYGDMFKVPGPVEFLNGVGVVCQKDGKYDIHFHATMCDKEGKVFGGHIVKGENPVLTTVDMVIYEISGAKLLRKYEAETDLTQFSPEK